MEKVRIKLITIGHLPLHLNLSQVSTWNSGVFELAGNIETFALRGNSDGPSWEFTDQQLREQLPTHNADFLLAIVNVPIEDGWYSRRLGNNQIVFTFSQIRESFILENIPLENAILRVLYAYTLLFLRSGNKIPRHDQGPSFTHDETRGCLFDMNGIKADLIESCNKPILCSECEERLRSERVANEPIEAVQKEIRKIRKRLYYRVLDFVKISPLIALAISSIFAILLGITSSLVASYIYDSVRPATPSITSSQSNDLLNLQESAATTASDAQGEILSPKDKEKVSHEVKVQGKTNHVPYEKERWLLVYAPLQKRWYPIEITGNALGFEKTIQLGRREDDYGEQFKLSLFFTDKSGGRFLRASIDEGLDTLPDGTEMSQLIVTRR